MPADRPWVDWRSEDVGNHKVSEVGGDSWASWGALKWLEGNGYRFNDISPRHVAQFSEGKYKGRSVLHHVGHSDGTQLDLRYSDGMGGNDDEMGGALDGAHILKVLKNAEKDVYESGMASSPNLIKAVNWIVENRRMLEREAGSARAIYAGHQWMQDALYYGVFPSGKEIPFSGEGAVAGKMPRWKNKPSVLKFGRLHFHHWHISLSSGSR